MSEACPVWTKTDLQALKTTGNSQVTNVELVSQERKACMKPAIRKLFVIVP